MGKTTGFMEYKRQESPYRDELERIKDWNELNNPLCEADRITQASRCMDCGTPFCHSGIIFNGLPSGCPLNNLIPEWNDLLYHGMWEEALYRLLKTNNFPEFTGKVCPSPCEGACTLGITSPQVTIRNNELAIIEKGFEEGWIKPFIPVKRSGKKVAVIGSGPSGLACAEQLNKVGHLVTIYEKADRPGGLLTYGIPNMKLDKKFVKRRTDLMEKSGITFVLNTEAGKDITKEELLATYDSIVICSGSTTPRDLRIDNRDASGIYYAVDYLSSNTRSLLSSNHEDGQYINAKGLNVIVIGGGDTGNDCVATAIRQGCKSIRQFEIMPEAALERSSDNPWPEFPKVKKVDYGQKEAIAVFGNDPREYNISTKSFEKNEDNQVIALNTVKVEWSKDYDGRFFPREIKGSEEKYEADLVLLAMGFVGPDRSLVEAFGITLDGRGNIKAEYKNHSTNVDKVFAAGDTRRGQSLVVWAIREGREAAKQVDTFLMGSSNLP
ncbi:MAG: glutamate synthase subunit beta [Clostridia bacterium]|nr:glutamate synthase subunit beta [Clostridia bacterium]